MSEDGVCLWAGLNSTGWAEGWLSWDFELLCGSGGRAPLSDWQSCNLGAVPPNTVMTRPVLTTRIYDFLIKSQVRVYRSRDIKVIVKYDINIMTLF